MLDHHRRKPQAGADPAQQSSAAPQFTVAKLEGFSSRVVGSDGRNNIWTASEDASQLLHFNLQSKAVTSVGLLTKGIEVEGTQHQPSTAYVGCSQDERRVWWVSSGGHVVEIDASAHEAVGTVNLGIDVASCCVLGNALFVAGTDTAGNSRDTTLVVRFMVPNDATSTSPTQESKGNTDTTGDSTAALPTSEAVEVASLVGEVTTMTGRDDSIYCVTSFGNIVRIDHVWSTDEQAVVSREVLAGERLDDVGSNQATASLVAANGHLWVGFDNGAVVVAPGLHNANDCSVDETTAASDVALMHVQHAEDIREDSGGCSIHTFVDQMNRGTSVWSASDGGDVVCWDAATFAQTGAFNCYPKNPAGDTGRKVTALVPIGRSWQTSLCAVNVHGDNTLWTVDEPVPVVCTADALMADRRRLIGSPTREARQAGPTQYSASCTQSVAHETVGNNINNQQVEELEDQIRALRLQKSTLEVEHKKLANFVDDLVEVVAEGESGGAAVVLQEAPASVKEALPRAEVVVNAVDCLLHASTELRRGLGVFGVESTTLIRDLQELIDAATGVKERADALEANAARKEVNSSSPDRETLINVMEARCNALERDLQQTKDRWAKKLEAAQGVNADLKDRLEAQYTDHDHATTKLKELQLALERCKRDNSRLMKEQANLQAVCNKQSSSITQLREELEGVVERSDATSRTLTQTEKNVEKRVKENRMLRDEISQLRKECQRAVVNEKRERDRCEQLMSTTEQQTHKNRAVSGKGGPQGHRSASTSPSATTRTRSPTAGAAPNSRSGSNASAPAVGGSSSSAQFPKLKAELEAKNKFVHELLDIVKENTKTIEDLRTKLISRKAEAQKERESAAAMLTELEGLRETKYVTDGSLKKLQSLVAWLTPAAEEIAVMGGGSDGRGRTHHDLIMLTVEELKRVIQAGNNGTSGAGRSSVKREERDGNTGRSADRGSRTASSSLRHGREFSSLFDTTADDVARSGDQLSGYSHINRPLQSTLGGFGNKAERVYIDPQQHVYGGKENSSAGSFDDKRIGRPTTPRRSSAAAAPLMSPPPVQHGSF